MSKTTISILGSTGSVGTSTLDVISNHPERFELDALTANNNVDKMLQQCLEYNPKRVVLACERAATQLRQDLATEGVHHIDVEAG